MNGKRLLGVCLLLVGIGLLVVGGIASDSLANQVSRIFSGHFTERTTAYLLGGLALTLVGLVLAAVGGRRGTDRLLN